MHVASPFIMEEPKDPNDLIKPAKEGTLRVLKFAKEAKVQRVVITSSIAAMFSHMKDGKFDTNTWTNLNSKQPNSYQRSKTIAEKAAWEFFHNQKGDHKLEMAVINPGGVLGPTLSPDLDGVSLRICVEMITGKMPGVPNLNVVMVDVRDVAEHHFKAMISKDANGKRFISAHAQPRSFFEVSSILRQNGFKKAPSRKIPTFLLKIMSLFDREARGMVSFVDTSISCDNSRTVTMFNWKPIPLEKTVTDMGRTVDAILKKKTYNI